MACPICGDYRGDTLCPQCQADGYEENFCGCIECPSGVRLECSPEHALCDTCGINNRQAGDTICGPCRAEEEREARQVLVFPEQEIRR